MIEEIKERVEKKMSKLLKIKKLKKRVIRLKKRCKKYKKLVHGLQDQLNNVEPKTVEVSVIEKPELFNDLEITVSEVDNLFAGTMVLPLKKQFIKDLRLKLMDTAIELHTDFSDNPLNIYMQAENLAEHLGLKVKDGGFQLENKPENSINVPPVVLATTAPIVIKNTAVVVPAKKEIKVETATNPVQPGSPAIPVKKEASQQNPK